MADSIAKGGTPYGADPQFQAYYDAISSQIAPQTVDYTAPTIDEIAAQISGYLRPSTDAQIRSRQAATVKQRAATDADAASRGMLPSTWVTDYKNRLAQQENADIADIESAYRAQLLQGVASRQQEEADRAYQIAMFNAQMRQAAEESAYNRAGDMYQIYLNRKSHGSSSGSGSSEEVSLVDDFNASLLKLQDQIAQNMGNMLSGKPNGQPVLNLSGNWYNGGLR